MTNLPAAAEAIPVAQVLQFARRHWLGGVAGALVGAAAGVAAALLQSPVYRSQVVLSPNTESMAGSGLGDLVGQFGGLAALAGIRMPNGSNKQEAIEYLRSRGLAAQFIEDEGLLPTLFERKWDPDANRWRVDDEDIPTLNDGVEYFVRRVRRLQEDRSSGMVTLTVDWRDRHEAARWASEMVRRANHDMRAQAVDEAQRSIDYLERLLQEQEQVPIREAMFKVIENQTKTVMLATVREQYAFRVLDGPVVADEDDFVSPNRPLLVVVGLLLGAVVGVIGSTLRSAIRNTRD